MSTRKQYYKCFKFIDGQTVVKYWHTSNMSSLLSAYDNIIPLGYRKPHNISRKEILE